MKRFMDVILSLVLMFILFPMILFLYLIISMDGGSPIYKQLRVGREGKLFTIYKFRSMIVDADKIGAYSTSDGDKRITKIGLFIRRSSMDELPQLFNVLKGDMSLVGPRPNVEAQRSEYTQEQWDKRNSVLPGITGLAQATLRSRATWQQRYDLDINYIEKISWYFDIYIIFLTIKQIFTKGGN